jgi:hypothetical protein
MKERKTVSEMIRRIFMMSDDLSCSRRTLPRPSDRLVMGRPLAAGTKSMDAPAYRFVKNLGRGKMVRRACRILTCLLILSPSAGCRQEREPPASEPRATTSPSPRAGGLVDRGVKLVLEATYPEGFSFLNGVRELADGTLVAADPLAQVLLHIDLDAGTADTLGRVGPGPQEYEQPDQVFPLPGDSSLLVDLGKMQLTEIAPDGRLGSGISMALPTEDGTPIVLHPRFVDRQGRLYYQAGRSRDRSPPDSGAVVRFQRSTQALDTVATVWLPEYQGRRTRGHGILPRLLEARDDWAVGPDGRVAVIRASDFSVEWRYSDGTVAEGPPFAFETETVGRSDKEAILEDLRSSGIQMMSVASRTGGTMRMSMSRGIPNSGDAPGVDDFEWAETFPPFRPERTLVSPDGSAWVERWLPPESNSRWEVFDDEGVWTGSVTLPPRCQIIGFGQGAAGELRVYVARSDELELKWLERYRVVG